MASFVRLAAKARAAEAIQRDQQITLSQQDFKAFHAAIAQPFEPNAALQDALEQACTRGRLVGGGALDPTRQNRKEFCCGEPALDCFLKQQAHQNMRRSVNQTFVLVPAEAPGPTTLPPCQCLGRRVCPGC